MKRVVLIIVDVFIIFISFLISYLIRYDQGFLNILIENKIFILPVILTNILALYYFNLFDNEDKTFVDIIFNVIFAVSIATVLMTTIGFFDRTFALPRVVMLYIWIGNVTFLSTWHIIARPSFKEKKRTIIIGADKKIIPMLKNYDILGFIDDKRKKPVLNYPILGKLSDIRRILTKYRISDVIIALPPEMHNKILDIVLECKDLYIDIYTVPHLYEFILTGSHPSSKLINLNIEPLSFYTRLMKRVFDLVLAIIGLIVFALPMLIIGIIVILDFSGPVLYRQKRLKKYSKTFYIYKFRTMIKDAEKGIGPVISDNKKDKRITNFGRFLRKTHLDELPQLFSILKGDMSFVGPRPERPELAKKFSKKIKEWNKRVYIKPGLTGVAQINNITGLKPDEKIKSDIFYLRNQSLFLDIKIILQQLKKVILNK